MNTELKVLSIIGGITVVLIIGGVIFLSQENSVSSNENSLEVDSSLLTAQSSHSITYPDAKVTITEFADYQCPACAMYYPQIKQVLKEYEGKVNFHYRHFPLPMHPFAKTAARAAEAAGEQDKFWEMSELLYTRQTSWSEGSPSTLFVEYAKELGLNENQFNNDFNSSKYDERITVDLNDAKSLGVNSTPTVYINNKKMTKAPTVQNLRREIESLLK